MTEQQTEQPQAQEPVQEQAQVPPYQPPYPQPVRRLTRSTEDKMIAGVCGGIAAHLNVDPTLVRVAAVIALVAAFPAVLVGYLVAWAIVPRA